MPAPNYRTKTGRRYALKNKLYDPPSGRPTEERIEGLQGVVPESEWPRLENLVHFFSDRKILELVEQPSD